MTTTTLQRPGGVSANPVRAEDRPQRATIRLWLPVLLIWLILVPVAVICLPLILAAGLIYRVSPWMAMERISDLLFALGGTQIEIENPGALMRIKFL
ncbi:MAG: hypothetical protein ACHP84_14480 [Caulobacterales bacterium]|jgi:hypothetical protein